MAPLTEVLLVAGKAALAYAAIVALLRVTGNRTLSKLRAFDLVVTIALGTVLASAAITPGVTLAQAIAAMVAFVGLQWLVAWASTRSGRVNALVTSPPRLVWWDGRYLDRELRRARVTEAQVRLAMRQGGHADEREVLAVILEPNGELVALARPKDGSAGLARDAKG